MMQFKKIQIKSQVFLRKNLIKKIIHHSTNKKALINKIEGFWGSGGPPYTLRKISRSTSTLQK